MPLDLSDGLLRCDLGAEKLTGVAATLLDVKLAWPMIGYVLAMSVAPLAHADDNDTAYLVAIQSVGVPASSPATATAYGRGLCDRISAVGFDPLVAAVHNDNISVGVTMHQSALIIGSAISNYCIDKYGLLPKTLDY
jgi:hypothetical protein